MNRSSNRGDRTPPQASFTVMTFNLRTFTANDAGNEWLHRASWAAETIADHKPSFVGVQEAYPIMLDDLRRRLPEYAWIGEGRRGSDIEDEACAIFYLVESFEPIGQGQFWLSETPDSAGSLGWDSDYPRICTWGLFRHRASGERIRVYNTHFDHIGGAARIEGAKLVASVMLWHEAEHPGSASILMGDMNGAPSDAPLRYLRGELPEEGAVPALQDAYARLEGSPGRTFHDFRGGIEGEPIDYIFATAPLEVLRGLIDRRSFEGKYPSDHYPLVAELRLGRK